jgi:bacillithiol synthase
LNQEVRLTPETIRDLIQREPERFSPNVILRPLYQEIILPNLAYIGGPAELVYWLQLKGVFHHFKIPFPLLMPRNFAMIIDHALLRKFHKTGLEIKDLFEPKNFLFNHWILKNTHHNLNLSDSISNARKIFESIRIQTDLVDSTLATLVRAREQQTVNQIESIEKKLLRAEKRRHTEKLQQLEAIKDQLFPDGSLQERTDNFLNFYQQDPGFIQLLTGALDPFDYRMHVVMYND